MKFLSSSQNLPEAGLLLSRLESAGIECEIRNEYNWSLFPGSAFYPEVWVLRDDQFAKAKELLAAWSSTAPSREPDE